MKWPFVFVLALVLGSLTARGVDAEKVEKTDKRETSRETDKPDRQSAQIFPDFVSPYFDFSVADFRAFAQTHLEAAYRQNAQAEAQDFLERLAQVIAQERQWPYLSLLVDKKHSLPAGYEPKDLVALESYAELNLLRDGLRLRALVLPPLLRMHQAALAAGVAGGLPITSTYRSFAYQKQLFERYAQRDGEAAANRYAAYPGQSQHQLGLTLDFAPVGAAFAETAAGQWLLANALDYGFSLSYPDGQEAFTGYSYEPWHYRYVGKEIAALISRYFGGLQQAFFVFWQRASGPLKHRYIVDELD